MSAASAQLRFAADVAVFLVAGAGLTLLVARGHLLVADARARGPVAAGFVLVAAGAFAHGAGLVDDPSATSLVILRVAGVVLLSVAPARWSGAALGRLGFAAG